MAMPFGQYFDDSIINHYTYPVTKKFTIMTTTFNLSHNRPPVKKHGNPDNARLYLLMVLLGVLTLFFAFGKPGKGHYPNQSLNGNEVTSNNKIEKADPETLYKTIVTNGDAIRSVLQ